jgi:AcrR family transcriptional regulator
MHHLARVLISIYLRRPFRWLFARAKTLAQVIVSIPLWYIDHKMATTSEPPRPLRVDAQRNHDRIVAAADEAFAELGIDVSMEEIARRAGVGPATVYRRFPSKHELLVAIIDAGVAELEPVIAAAAGADDALAGLLAGMSAVLQAQAANASLVQVLAEAGALGALKEELATRILGPLCELMDRAQRDGQIRADLEPKELPALMRMVAATIDGWSWPRYLALLTDALRTAQPSTLPPR